ncbi:class A sortase [Lacticaseibacillus mingshuiensis]|uniref:Class A sortase n=1 Tax=Lacticaseibacillus mingshuiensis TaxID=2799574 RepID=A0ABW4CJ61_9LACO|nr:class A sortase [Lacticaseibacillus mingshuiensis]
MADRKNKKHTRGKTWLWRTLLVLGLVVGLALVFNEQIKLFVVNWMGQSTMKTISKETVKKNEKKEGNFDFKSVKALDVATVGKATTSKVNGIGKIAIPSVKMRLPILLGLANENLSQGAGTMNAGQKMGDGNYALAGHYMTASGVLFSPLKGVEKGDNMYITDMSKVYTYRVTTKTVVYETQVQWIEDVPGKKLLTLITCASPTEGETHRIVVQGELTKTAKATSSTLSVFD